MDQRLAQLSERVAAAADAWLTDPRDSGIYARLVDAITARHRYLHPPLGDDPDAEQQVDERDVDRSGPAVGDVADLEVLDALGDEPQGGPARVGVELGGTDPRAVLRRLANSDVNDDGRSGQVVDARGHRAGVRLMPARQQRLQERWDSGRPDELLTVTEVALVLPASPAWVARRMSDGTLATVRNKRGHRVARAADVRELAPPGQRA